MVTTSERAADLNLFLVDVAQSALDHATQRFHTYAKKALDRGKLSETAAKRVTGNLHTILDYERFATQTG